MQEYPIACANGVHLGLRILARSGFAAFLPNWPGRDLPLPGGPATADRCRERISSTRSGRCSSVTAESAFSR